MWLSTWVMDCYVILAIQPLHYIGLEIHATPQNSHQHQDEKKGVLNQLNHKIQWLPVGVQAGLIDSNPSFGGKGPNSADLD